MVTETAATRRTDIYNDPAFNYAQFWVGRDYEHHAEVIALRRLLRGRRFRHAVDIGGGYGRLSVILTGYAEKVTLVDPSSQQLELSAQLYPGRSALDRRLADAAHLQFPDGSADLVTLIRVLHHLPDPEPELAELARIGQARPCCCRRPNRPAPATDLSHQHDQSGGTHAFQAERSG